jgi:copper homeostasis protein
MRVELEVCLDGVESAIAAQEGGASRVELCDNLLEGGTTPSRGAMELARERVAIGVHVMIRPRGGDFLYSPVEMEVMRRDIAAARQVGVRGVVLGLLRPDGAVDAARTRELVESARPLSVTFHRAFDMARDPLEALDSLLEIGVDRVLTSGQAPSVPQGMDLIAELVRRSGDRLIIMPGGGVTPENAREVVERTGVREIHVGGPVAEVVESGMRFRNSRVYMGDPGEPEYSTRRVSARKVRALVDSLAGP